MRRSADAGRRRQPFEVIQALVSDVLTVPDPEVVQAMRFAFERLKIVLEPSGANALAALDASTASASPGSASASPCRAATSTSTASSR